MSERPGQVRKGVDDGKVVGRIKNQLAMIRMQAKPRMYQGCSPVYTAPSFGPGCSFRRGWSCRLD